MPRRTLLYVLIFALLGAIAGVAVAAPDNPCERRCVRKGITCEKNAFRAHKKCAAKADKWLAKKLRKATDRAARDELQRQAVERTQACREARRDKVGTCRVKEAACSERCAKKKR